jgi:hypothetical protein
MRNLKKKRRENIEREEETNQETEKNKKAKLNNINIEESYLLECDAMESRISLPTFRRKLALLPSGRTRTPIK